MSSLNGLSRKRKRNCGDSNASTVSGKYVFRTQNQNLTDSSALLAQFPCFSSKLTKSSKFLSEIDPNNGDLSIRGDFDLSKGNVLEFCGKRSSKNCSKTLIFKMNEKTHQLILINQPKHHFPYEFSQNIITNTTKLPKNSIETYETQRNALISAFGSKVSRKIEKSREKGEIKAENLQNVKEVKQTQSSDYEDTLIKAKRALLPPFDVKTSKKKKVFPMKTLFSSDTRNCMKYDVEELRKQMIGSEKLNFNELHQLVGAFVKQRVSLVKIKKLKKNEEKFTFFIERLLFISLINQIRAINRRVIPEEFMDTLKCSNELSNHLFQRFFIKKHGKKGYEFNKNEMNKMVYQYLVCILFESDFKIDFEIVKLLQIDLKLEITKVYKYCYELGCKKRGSSYHLLAPLVFNLRKRS